MNKKAGFGLNVFLEIIFMVVRLKRNYYETKLKQQIRFIQIELEILNLIEMSTSTWISGPICFFILISLECLALGKNERFLCFFPELISLLDCWQYVDNQEKVLLEILMDHIIKMYYGSSMPICDIRTIRALKTCPACPVLWHGPFVIVMSPPVLPYACTSL